MHIAPATWAPSAAAIRFAPFALFVLVLMLRGLIGDGVPIDERWLYAMQSASAGVLLWRWRKRYPELTAAPLNTMHWTLAAAAGTAMFVLWVQPVPAWMHSPESGPPFVPIDASGALQWDLIALRAAGAVLVVPLMEELFWRSFLMRWIERRDFLTLNPKQVGAVGLVLSSGVFALGHTLWLAGLLAGLAYGWLYRRTGNLWYPIGAHALTNALLAFYVVRLGAWQFW